MASGVHEVHARRVHRRQRRREADYEAVELVCHENQVSEQIRSFCTAAQATALLWLATLGRIFSHTLYYFGLKTSSFLQHALLLQLAVVFANHVLEHMLLGQIFIIM